MDNSPDTAPAGWLAVLEESDADIAAGRVVAGDTVMRDLKGFSRRFAAEAKRQSLLIQQAARDPASDEFAVMRELEADLEDESFWRE